VEEFTVRSRLVAKNMKDPLLHLPRYPATKIGANPIRKNYGIRL